MRAFELIHSMIDEVDGYYKKTTAKATEQVLLIDRAILAAANSTHDIDTEGTTLVEAWALDAVACTRLGHWKAAQHILDTFEFADWDEYGDEDPPYRKDYTSYEIQEDGVIIINYTDGEEEGMVALIPAKETS